MYKRGQKQSPRCVFLERCSQKCHEIHEERPVAEPFLRKLQGSVLQLY